MRVTDKTGPIADLKVVEPDDRLLIITAGGIVIRTRVDEIRRIGRATEGVRVINLKTDDRVASIEAVAKAEPSERPQAREWTSTRSPMNSTPRRPWPAWMAMAPWMRTASSRRRTTRNRHLPSAYAG